MWLWTRQEAKEIDQRTVESGVSEEHLMETAGQKSASALLRRYPRARSALVFCGPGHNGGDGFVVARKLLEQNLNVTAVHLTSPHSSALRRSQQMRFRGRVLSVDEYFQQWLQADLWIDALFGIGLNRPLDPQSLRLIEHFNESEGIKVALDTPSGLDVDRGTCWGACVRADRTLTVGHAKPGFFINEGPAHCGHVECLDIGFPKEISKSIARSVFLMSSRLSSRWLPDRKPTDHKSRGGRTLVLAGNREMPGAGILACRAAGRVGAGYIYTHQREVIDSVPETLLWRKNYETINSVLIGPGLGINSQTARKLHSLMHTQIPVVVDADALTVAARQKRHFFPAHWVATPHAGELARFLECSPQEIESDRLRSAQRAQKLLGCTVLLKGFHTVIATAEVNFIVASGNVALAKGGSGDVLGGMIAGFLAQGLSPVRASLLACDLHGKIADEWVRSGRDLLSLTPSDLLDLLPFLLRHFRNFKTGAVL